MNRISKGRRGYRWGLIVLLIIGVALVPLTASEVLPVFVGYLLWAAVGIWIAAGAWMNARNLERPSPPR